MDFKARAKRSQSLLENHGHQGHEISHIGAIGLILRRASWFELANRNVDSEADESAIDQANGRLPKH